MAVVVVVVVLLVQLLIQLLLLMVVGALGQNRVGLDYALSDLHHQLRAEDLMKGGRSRRGGRERQLALQLLEKVRQFSRVCE